MAPKSMTGFARADGSGDGASWHVEVRSVNGRGLDLRFRLPPGYEALEPQFRRLAQKQLSRGSVSMHLQMIQGEGTNAIRLNDRVLDQILAATEVINQRTTVAPYSAVDLLALKGVLEISNSVEIDAETRDARQAGIMATLETVLVGLIAARMQEGARLKVVIEEQIVQIEALVQEVEQSPARMVEAVSARLKRQITALLEAGDGPNSPQLDEQRLYQEAALLATRADVEEELKRLHAHIAAARDLLAAEKPIGRQLDFLAQEFNREANTLCSKSNDADMTRAGLALKAVIDQMREQVQNIE